MKTVLIIDDHPMIRGTVASVLNADDELKVIGECGDGEDGLKMAFSESPDLVILDLDLPRLDGLSLIRRIRSQNDEIRILVLSAKMESVMATHTRLAGANGYVGKGREIGELVIAAKTVYLDMTVFLPIRSARQPKAISVVCRLEKSKFCNISREA